MKATKVERSDVEGKLGEYSIMKEPREERPHSLIGQIFSIYI